MLVLVLTARDTVSDIVLALDLGVDDYLTKPFAMAEFMRDCVPWRAKDLRCRR